MFRVRTQLGLTDAFMKSDFGWTWQMADSLRSSFSIAVLDSGVELHPDLKGRVAVFRDFTGRHLPGGRRIREHVPYDEYGHGTHVCGILCGSGVQSRGRYQGIFPWGKLVVGKVLDQRGNGAAENMLEGMEWVLRQKERYHIEILNISVAISELKDPQKVRMLQEMLLRMTREGILVVCAAGNMGPRSGSLSALGEMPQVLSVGCHDGAYYRMDPLRCERYCGRGKEKAVPRKPDLVAPGTKIISCNANHGIPYEERSGTSMATPIVSGCLALAKVKNPKLSPNELTRALLSTCKDLGEPWNKQGWGMIQPRRLFRELS